MPVFHCKLGAVSPVSNDRANFQAKVDAVHSTCGFHIRTLFDSFRIYSSKSASITEHAPPRAELFVSSRAEVRIGAKTRDGLLSVPLSFVAPHPDRL